MIAGRYSLEREVGRGGMGAVWLAHDEVLDRVVAMKRIGGLPGDEPADLRRARREGRAAAMLNHPNVVPVFDLVAEHDEQWLVMEYVDGLNLSELVRKHGRLSPDDSAYLLRQAADALAAAHRAGIVHRDVKPSNILVTRAGQLKLTDFGIARAHGDATLTTSGLIVGSPGYLAPEVVSGAAASQASDVWSLGATLYFSLVGSPAYDASDNMIGTLYKIVHEAPPRPSEAGWLAPLLDGMMAPDPQDRWSMTRVLGFLEGGPSSTPSPGVARTVALEAPAPPPEPAPPVSAAAPPPVPSTPGRATTVLPGAPPEGRPPVSGRGRRARGWIAAGIAGLVVALAYLAWTLWGGEPEETAQTPPPQESSPTVSELPSPSPSPSPSEEGPNAQDMTAFVQTYLATVTEDQAAAWAMLTPEFQVQSGSFAGYRRAWRSRPGVEVSNIVADPENMTVTYDVSYSDRQGRHLFDDHVTLTLAYEDGEYLIAGEQ